MQSTDENIEFYNKVVKDLKGTMRDCNELKDELKRYYKEQYRVLGDIASDTIADRAIADRSDETEGAAQLLEKRQVLMNKCDTIYETLCLLVSVFVFATEF